MIAIEIKLNLLWVFVGVILLPLVGFLFRSAQITKAKSKIQILEREMLDNHAEILQLQEKIASLQQSDADSNAPVVPLKENNVNPSKYPPKESGGKGAALKSLL